MWGRLRKILWREGADPTASEKFYRAVVQAVLLFATETWALTKKMIQRLEGDQKQLRKLGIIMFAT